MSHEGKQSGGENGFKIPGKLSKEDLEIPGKVRGMS